MFQNILKVAEILVRWHEISELESKIENESSWLNRWLLETQRNRLVETSVREIRELSSK